MRWSDAARVGGVVLLAALIVAGVVGIKSGFVLGGRDLYVAFANARGIQTGADVTYHGVRVGDVGGIEVQGSRAVLRLRMREPVVPERVQFTIVSPLIGFSGPHVEIVDLPPGKT